MPRAEEELCARDIRVVHWRKVEDEEGNMVLWYSALCRLEGDF